ncbi:MAG: formyl transferase [Anaerolineaceae bacterium]|nr:formyl transferase [Anaerolineaceae bacterium]
MSNQSIIILASRDELSYLLITHLAKHFSIAKVVFEAPHTRKMLRYRLKKLGAWTIAGQLAFLVLDRLFIRRQSRPLIEQLLKGHDASPPDGRIPTLEVDSVNGAEVTALLKEHKPQVVVVTGTGIIAKKILALAPTFINIHVGITPRYRGVHGGFWAVYEGRLDLAGTTIHRVDPGVDTGAIIAQVPITVEPNDTYRTLPVKQYLAALDAMTQAVQSALDGQLTTYERTDLDSQQWYSPTPLEYWRFLKQLPIKK